LVTKNAQEEIKLVQREKDELQGLLENREMDAEVAQRVDDLTIHQVRGLLVKSKAELQEASNQIKSLKEELRLQQKYFEEAMLEDKTEKQKLIDDKNEQNS